MRWVRSPGVQRRSGDVSLDSGRGILVMRAQGPVRGGVKVSTMLEDGADVDVSLDSCRRILELHAQGSAREGEGISVTLEDGADGASPTWFLGHLSRCLFDRKCAELQQGRSTPTAYFSLAS